MTSNFREFKDNGFTVKELKNNEEKEQAYKLRHEIFSDELGWVNSKTNHQEIDSYDTNCIMIGVYDNTNTLVGTARIIWASAPMMIEKEFSDLVSESHKIRKSIDTIEITRFGVKKSIRNKVQGQVSMALYKGLYLWSLLNHVRYLYMVVDRRMMFNLKIKGFPCKRLGIIKKNPDGCRAMSAILDWREFEEKIKPKSEKSSLRLNDPEFLGFCQSIATA